MVNRLLFYFLFLKLIDPIDNTIDYSVTHLFSLLNYLILILTVLLRITFYVIALFLLCIYISCIT